MIYILYFLIFYNILVYYSFNFSFKKLYFYWKNIYNISMPYDIDDFPYIKKFEMLYLLKNKLKNKINKNNNIQQFITSNKIPKIYPNISLKSIWTEDFRQILSPIMNNYDIIKEEIMNSLNHDIYKPIGKHYDSSNNVEIKNWTSFNIIKNRIDLDTNNIFKTTKELIQKIGLFYGWCFISILNPGAHIPRHKGRYNHKLTCHIGIDGLDNCEFIIDNNILKWKENDFFVFNDFSYHEVKHNGNKKRIVLIFDLFHPELNVHEIECLKILNI